MPKNTPKKQSDRYYYLLALRIAGDFGVSIAVPAVSAAFLGKWLDQKWSTEPWMLILLLVIAFAVTAVLIVKKAKYYDKLYKEGPK